MKKKKKDRPSFSLIELEGKLINFHKPIRDSIKYLSPLSYDAMLKVWARADQQKENH